MAQSPHDCQVLQMKLATENVINTGAENAQNVSK